MHAADETSIRLNIRSKRQFSARWMKLYDRTELSFPRSAIEQLKELYWETNPSRRSGWFDKPESIGATTVPNSKNNNHGILKRQKIYDRNEPLMSNCLLEWKLPDNSHATDGTSGVPFSHITLLCKHLICAECNCQTCCKLSPYI